MEPFNQDNSAFAFQKPFQPQGAAPKGEGSLHPFTAVDLAPPATPSTPAPLVPAVSPFLENLDSPFESGKGAAVKPAPGLEQRPRSGIKGAPVEDFIPVLPAVAAPAPTPTKVPVPAPVPALPTLQPAKLILPSTPDDLPSQFMAATGNEGAKPSSSRPRFFITSTASVDGFPIQAYLDVLSVEVVLPKDLLFRNPAPYGELHRLKAAEDQLQKVKAKALEELAEKGRQIDADGIVGLQINFVNLDTVCCLCSVVGTAIKIA